MAKTLVNKKTGRKSPYYEGLTEYDKSKFDIIDEEFDYDKHKEKYNKNKNKDIDNELF